MNSNAIIEYLKFFKEKQFIKNKNFILNFSIPQYKKWVKFTLLIDLFLIGLLCMQHDLIFRLLMFIGILYNTYFWFAYKKYIKLKATLYNTAIIHYKFGINACIIGFTASNWLLIHTCNKSNINYFFINHFGFYMILIPLLLATIYLIFSMMRVSRKKNDDLLDKSNISDDETTKTKLIFKMMVIIIPIIMLPLTHAIRYDYANYESLSIIIAILDFIVNLFMFMLVYIISFMYIFRHQIFNQEDYEKEYITQQD